MSYYDVMIGVSIFFSCCSAGFTVASLIGRREYGFKLEMIKCSFVCIAGGVMAIGLGLLSKVLL